jgi:hypothetical protein
MDLRLTLFVTCRGDVWATCTARCLLVVACTTYPNIVEVLRVSAPIVGEGRRAQFDPRGLS